VPPWWVEQSVLSGVGVPLADSLNKTNNRVRGFFIFAKVATHACLPIGAECWLQAKSSYSPRFLNATCPAKNRQAQTSSRTKRAYQVCIFTQPSQWHCRIYVSGRRPTGLSSLQHWGRTVNVPSRRMMLIHFSYKLDPALPINFLVVTSKYMKISVYPEQRIVAFSYSLVRMKHAHDLYNTGCSRIYIHPYKPVPLSELFFSFLNPFFFGTTNYFGLLSNQLGH
jgi:hypothetical protein